MSGNSWGRLTPVLAVVLVLAACTAGYLFYRLDRFDKDPLWASTSARETVPVSQRSQALAVAEQFSLRMDDIDGKDLDGYSSRILQMLTTKGKASFGKQFEAMKQLTVDPKTKGVGKVLASAVADIDSDSATVMVVHDSAVTNSQGSTGRHYRWLVELQKVGGKWLVDDFNPVD